MSDVKRYLNDGDLLPDDREYVLASSYDATVFHITVQLDETKRERDSLRAERDRLAKLLKEADVLIEEWAEILKAEGCKSSAIDAVPLRAKIDAALKSEEM